jgi:sodium-coupled neutral amino acid transporter 9
MSGFLYTVVDYVNDPNPTPSSTSNISSTIIPRTTAALAAAYDNISSTIMPSTTAAPTSAHGFNTYWTQEYVPLYLIAILFPLVNFKSLTFFTKFNSLGRLRNVTYSSRHGSDII